MALTEERLAEAPAVAAPDTRRRIVLGLALAVLTGVLGTLALPPFGIWPLIWVAFVPMLVAQHRVMPRRWSGVAFGVGFATYLAPQITPGFTEAGLSPFYQLFPVFAAAAVAALAWRSRAFHERTGYRWFILATPVAWVAIDFLRLISGRADLGGTWWNPVYALYSIPSFLQPVNVFSIFGLELLLLVVNFAVAALVLARLDGRRLPVRPALGVAAAVVAWGLLSASLMGSAPRTTPRVRVAAVQTGTIYAKGAQLEERVRRDFAQTRGAGAGGAQLVVWSEKGLHFDPSRVRTEELRDLARQTKATLVVGYGYDRQDGRHLNELVVVSPDGTVSERYGKDHPGTFAGDYSDTGGTYPVHRTAFGSLGTVICYDLDFTDTARKMTRNGARIIAAPSADPRVITTTHWTHLVFRAIENRVPTAKADTGADSAIIDPWGRVVTKALNPSGHGQVTLLADVPLGTGDTLVVRWGDWFGWVCLVGAAAFLALGRVTARRS
jgi:apolipoprotein N-acyltransferase